ncbi:MAG TPA: tetratricopeptide repeat protein, partial [Thermoanaerobaculia bacterium]
AGALAVLLAHGIGTHERNETWNTGETLWADVVAKSPANGRAWMNYGLTHMARGRYAEAKQSFDRAAALTPNYSVLEINLGIAENALGDRVRAEQHFRRALQLNPDHNAHYFFARWLVETGRGPEAVAHLQTAVRLSPAGAPQRALLLRVLAATGAEAELTALAAETRRIDPNEPALRELEQRFASRDAAFDEGLREIQNRNWLAAAIATRTALAFNADDADALNNLGWSLAQLGFTAEAKRAYEKALAIQPNHERARNNLHLLR